MDSIKGMLNHDPDQGYFCQYGGKAYRFQDIDYKTWQPKPSAEGRTRDFKRPEVFKIGDLHIHF